MQSGHSLFVDLALVQMLELLFICSTSAYPVL